jgi:hypothetical protein
MSQLRGKTAAKRHGGRANLCEPARLQRNTMTKLEMSESVIFLPGNVQENS